MPAQNPKSSLKKPDPTEVTMVPPPAKDLLEWESPARPFKKRDREYFTTIGAIVFLLTIILFFLKEWLLIGAIIAFAFLAYVLASIPPEKVRHKITTRGIITAGKMYKWPTLSRFWFSKKWGSDILNIETLFTMPGRLALLLDGQSKEKVKSTVEKYLVQDKPPATTLDKAGNWLTKKFPLEEK
jgi:hypothetical protein